MPLTETNFVPEKEIENVTREIEHVTRDIENVDKKINGIDELLAVTTEASERDYLRAEKAQLRRKEEQLRRKEEQLRRKEEQLRDEKKQLKASASINTNGTASKYQYKWYICEVWLVVIVTVDDLFVYSFIYLFIFSMEHVNNPWQGMEIVRVPQDMPFTKKIEDCELPISEAWQPVNLVDVDTTVNECVLVVQEQTNRATNLVQRKPPLCLSRLARGGKTTILMTLFDRLKMSNDDPEGFTYMPVYINFNGEFERFVGESDKEAILRLIAMQLIDTEGLRSDQRIVCDENELKAFINSSIKATGRRFVLLIDELNKLSYPPDAAAAKLLRTAFLDPKNRYLVFSTHLPVNVDPVNFIGGTSGRGIKCVDMPESFNLDAIQAIAPCFNAVTQTEIALCGGIPSLIYCMKIESGGKGTIDSKFHTATAIWDLQKWSHETRRDLLAAFLSTVINGLIAPVEFQTFSTASEDSFKFPLIYIGKILQYLNIPLKYKSVNAIVGLISKNLPVHSTLAGSGKDWEAIVNIAILLQCASSQINKSPLSIFGESFDRVEFVKCEVLPPQTKTLESAHIGILDKMAKARPGTVCVFSPSYASFPTFDGFVVYKEYHDSALTIIAHQEKAGRPRSWNPALPPWVTTAVMICGDPPKKSRKTTTNKNCKFLIKRDVEELLGYSLAPLLQANWESV